MAKPCNSNPDVRPVIGLDTIVLRPPFTGIPNYVLQLLRAVLADPGSDAMRFQAFAASGWRRIQLADLNAVAERTRHASSGLATATGMPFWRRMQSTMARLPLAHAAMAQVRATHFSGTLARQRLSFFHALLSRPPGTRINVPVLPAIYDLSFLKFPQTHTIARMRWMKPVEDLCRSAPMIHTISHSVARELVEAFGRVPSTIHVVEPGINPYFLRNDVADTDIVQRLSLQPYRYALSVSTLEPRKNLQSLLRAYADLAPAERRALPLVIVGARGWGDTRIGPVVGGLLAENSIRLTGYLSDMDLRTLYRHAGSLFYPSLYEGYGMPISEALALGCPVCVSATSSMPEAACGAGRLVEPLDIPGWRHELKRCLDSTDAADVAQRQTRQDRVAHLRWETSAKKLLAAYREFSALI